MSVVFTLAAVKLGYYGNWGGVGWSGGEILPSEVNRGAEVKDALDQTFKNHDINYEDAEKKLKSGDIDRAAWRDLINEADKQLLREMDALDLSSFPNAAEAEGMRDRARWWFERQVENHENPSVDETCDIWGGEPFGSCRDIPPSTSDDIAGAENFIRRRDPLTFDLDGDGIETVGINSANPILFDHDGDGLKTATGWVKADDAFLVLDRNGNGTIDNGTELFGDSTPLLAGGNAADGFAALAQEDTNQDGVVDSDDASFADLRLWRDLNQNGISEAGELSALTQNDIAAIHVGKVENNTLLPNGNVIADLGHYTKTDGSEGALGTTGQLGDVDLRENTFYSQFTDSVPITPEAAVLPNMHGSGQVRGLREAASLSPDLAQQLAAYSQATARDEQITQLDALLKGWSGTSTMLTTATGAYGTRPLTIVFEGVAEGSPAYAAWLEKLSVLERFNGRTFRPIPADPATPVRVELLREQQQLLDRAYATLHKSVYDSLFLQTRGKPYLDAIGLTVDTNGDVALDFSAMEALMGERVSVDSTNGILDIADIVRIAGTDLWASGWDGSRLGGIINSVELTDSLKTALAEANVFATGTTGLAVAGGVNDDLVFGNAADNTLSGGNGNDQLLGFAGNDLLDGGYGSDTYYFNRGDGHDTIVESGYPRDAFRDTLIFGPGIAPEDFRFTRIGPDLHLELGQGDDLTFRDWYHTETYFYQHYTRQVDEFRFADGRIFDALALLNVHGVDVFGTDGNDTLYGGPEVNRLYGYAGDDRLDGGAGDDSLWGDTGNDTLIGGAGNDVLWGAAGDDTLIGGGGSDILSGAEGDDLLNGGQGNNVYSGGAGNDTYVLSMDSGVDSIDDFAQPGEGNVVEFVINDYFWANRFDLSYEGSTLVVNWGTGSQLRLPHFDRTDVYGAHAVDKYRFELGAEYTYQDLISRGFRLVGTVADDTIDGTNGKDTILGDDGNDTLYGYEGNDSLDGGAGDDVLLGGEGRDALAGGDGNDVLDSGIGDDWLHDFGGDNVLYGGAGDDFFEVDDGDNYLDGGEGNDYFLAGSGDDTVLGGDGDDELHDFGGNNTFDSGAGNDRIESNRRGNNTLVGGEGDDVLMVYRGNDFNATNDQNVFTGGTGNDFLYGGKSAGTYVFNRGDGQDVINDDGYWDVGTDILTLGPGIVPGDLRLYRVYDDLLIEIADPANPGAGDRITVERHFDSYDYAVPSDFAIEEIVFADGSRLSHADIANSRSLLAATEGHDYIYGTLHDDVIFGFGGDDYLPGHMGDDTIYGEHGDDILSGEAGNDLLFGGEGNDLLSDHEGDNYLDGGFGDDYLAAGNGKNTLIGGEGNDWLSGGEGTNILIGGVGNDTYAIGGLGGVIVENPGEGVDTVTTGWSGYILPDNLENLVLSGTSGLTGIGNALDNVIRGYSYNDILIGLDGNDTLYGDYDTTSIGWVFGNDTLDGGAGDDYLDGGYGDDTYVFARGYGHDRIRETSDPWWYDQANGYDTLRLDGLLPGEVTVGRDGGDLTITVTDTGDRIAFSQVEQAVFADGTVWSSELLGLFADGVTFGPDVLTGTDGDDYLNGLSGDDTLYGLAGYDTLVGGEGDDLLDGGAGSDQLFGDAGDDVLLGGEGGDFMLWGGDGNDLLDGGVGVDEMRGGLGDDSYVVDHPYDQVREYSNEGTDTVFASIDYALVPLGLPDGGEIGGELGFFDTGIENITLIGDDNLRATGSPGDNVLTGNGGNNFLYGFGGNDILIGGAGNDTYFFDVMPGIGEELPGPILFVSDVSKGRPGPIFPVASTLVIEENDATPGNLDLLMFGSGLDLGDMTVEAVGRDLVLRFDSGEQVTVRNWYLGDEHHVEFLQFADGTVLETAAIAPVVASPPVVVFPLADLNIDEDSDFSLDAASTFSDPDGDILGYTAALNDGTALPSWLLFDTATGFFSGMPTNDDVASLDITVTATDSFGFTASDTFILAVNNVNDDPIVANGVTDQSTDEDSPFSFTLDNATFTDDDLIHGDSLSLSVALADRSDLPSWLAFDAATGSFSGTPDNGDVGVYDIRVTATDESGATASTVFALTINNTNDIPIVANSIADQSTDEDSLYTFNLADLFTDDDLIHGDSLTLSAVLADGFDLPDWLTFDASTGTFTGTPDNLAVGTYDIQVTATDLAGTSAFDVFTLTVNNVNDNPVLANALGDLTTDEDTPFGFTVSSDAFFDDDLIHGDSLTLSATLADGSILPDWFSFDASTGTFTGTPDNWDVGSYDVRVTATDTAGTSVSDVFSLTVNNVNDAPVLANPLSDRMATEGVAFSYALAGDTFHDDDAIHGDTLSYTATLADGGDLPSWLTFDAASQTFTGTASADSMLVGTDGNDVLIDTDTGISGVLDVQVTTADTAGVSASDIFTLTLQGVPGNDTLEGGKGNDVLNGGGGNDTYIYNLGDGLDTLTDGEGTDTVVFGSGFSFDNTVIRIDSSSGIARLRFLDADGCETEEGMDITLNPDGTSPIETFALADGTSYTLADLAIRQKTWYGDKKANTLVTGRHDDTIYAGKGGDTVYAGTGNDTLYGEKGNDKLYGEGGNDALYGGKGKDLLNGGCGDDLLDGGKDKDTLLGGKGHDTLIGGEGKDRLTGGQGDDLLIIGENKDTIYFGLGDGHDTVRSPGDDHRAHGDEGGVVFGASITQDNLWFRRIGNDLAVNVLGTQDGLTFQGWYDEDTRRGHRHHHDKDRMIEEFETADGHELEAKQVALLVQAMASFAPAAGSGTPFPTEMPNELQATLAAAWETGH